MKFAPKEAGGSDLSRGIEGSTQKIVVVHNAMDDKGGVYESSEGGRYLMPEIRKRMAETRMDTEELDVIEMNLPNDPGDPKAKYLDSIVHSAPKGIHQVHEAFMEGNKVLSLGGNHVRALDVIGAMRACHKMGIPFGMIWIDQHPDLNTPDTTQSGNIHGMVSAVLQGKGAKELLGLLEGAPFIDPKNIVYVGIREDAIDGHETMDENGKYAEGTEGHFLQELEEKGVKCFTAESMNENKKENRVSDEAKEAVKELSDRIKGKGGKLWTEWDVDVVDTEDMPASVMNNPNGLSAAQMQDLFDYMEEYCSVDGMGVSEISPEKDIDGKSRDLVTEGVAKILGISTKQAVQLTINMPSKWRRLAMQLAGGVAAGIGTIIAGHQLSNPPAAPTKPLVDNSHSEFLNHFSGSNFRNTATKLKRAVDSGDKDGIKRTLSSLATIYVQAKQKAPSTAAQSDLGRVALSEFTHGFTEGSFAGSEDIQQYYQAYTEEVRSIQKNA